MNQILRILFVLCSLVFGRHAFADSETFKSGEMKSDVLACAEAKQKASTWIEQQIRRSIAAGGDIDARCSCVNTFYASRYAYTECTVDARTSSVAQSWNTVTGSSSNPLDACVEAKRSARQWVESKVKVTGRVIGSGQIESECRCTKEKNPLGYFDCSIDARVSGTVLR